MGGKPAAYRSDIDGLRAVAVVPVVIYHLGVHAIRGGFVGVDVFFVISGYLITQVLIGDIEQGRFSILGFYERRVRRILPALLAVLAATAAVYFNRQPTGRIRRILEDLAGRGGVGVEYLFLAARRLFRRHGIDDAPVAHLVAGGRRAVLRSLAHLSLSDVPVHRKHVLLLTAGRRWCRCRSALSARSLIRWRPSTGSTRAHGNCCSAACSRSISFRRRSAPPPETRCRSLASR